MEPELIWERPGHLLRAGSHNHPNALRIYEPVFYRFRAAFANANPKFNYYGPTEYGPHQMTVLCNELNAWATIAVGKGQFRRAEVAGSVVALAKKAMNERTSLLVLGV
jgi:hypothetical protein